LEKNTMNKQQTNNSRRKIMIQTQSEQPRGYVAVTREQGIKLCLVFQDFTYTPNELLAARAQDADTVYMLGRAPRRNQKQKSYLVAMVEDAKKLRAAFHDARGKANKTRLSMHLCFHPDVPVTYPVNSLPGDKPFPSLIWFGHLAHLNNGPLTPAGTPRALGMSPNNLFAAAGKGFLKNAAGDVIAPDDYMGMLGVMAYSKDELARSLKRISDQAEARRLASIEAWAKWSNVPCTV
jgi:hypothetical protein